MKKVLKFSAAVAAGALALLSSAQAAEVWGSGNLWYVYPMADGSFVITFRTDPGGCPSTGTPKYLYVTPGQNGVTADGAKAMLATALTAVASGKELRVAFSDSSTSCFVNRMLVVGD